MLDLHVDVFLSYSVLIHVQLRSDRGVRRVRGGNERPCRWRHICNECQFESRVNVGRIDARLLLTIGFALIAIGSWMDTGLTHDWASGDFLPSQIVEAVGLAIGITSLITFAVSNITPPQAAAIAATIQIARLFGIEMGTAFIQTFVRVT